MSKIMDGGRALLSNCEAARRLGLAAGTLANKRSRGQGPAWVKCGRSVRYRSEDLEVFISAHRVVPGEQPQSLDGSLPEIEEGLFQLGQEIQVYGSFENTPDELLRRYAALWERWTLAKAREEGLA